MTTRQAVIALLAGTAAVIGVVTLAPLTGVEAQDRGNVAATARSLRSAEFTDGGVDRRAQLDEACAAALAAYESGFAAHVETGTPPAAQVAQLADTSDAACAAIQTLRDSIEAARLVHAVQEQVYLCTHVDSRRCPPDGGTP